NPVLVTTGAEFLLSMVENGWAARNGDRRKMESGLRAQQELAKIEEHIAQLESIPGQNEEIRRQIQQLHERMHALRTEVTGHVDAWARTELARHPQRPHLMDYVERIFTDWSEIHGDRRFADDHAMVCGMARFHGEEVVVI